MSCVDPQMHRVLRRLAAVALAVLAAPAAARDNPFPTLKEWAMPQAFLMQRDFGSVATCAGLQATYDAKGWPRGVSLESLQEIDRKLKKSVILRPDVGLDKWTPLTRLVLEAKRKPAADCDDVAVTSAQLAVCAGFPAENLGLLVTQLPSRANELHVVSFYNDPGNGVWVFGDTMGKVRPYSKLAQKAYYYAFLDDVTEWWALRTPDGEVLTGQLPTSSLPTAPNEVTRESTTCLHKHTPDAGQSP